MIPLSGHVTHYLAVAWTMSMSQAIGGAGRCLRTWRAGFSRAQSSRGGRWCIRHYGGSATSQSRGSGYAASTAVIDYEVLTRSRSLNAISPASDRSAALQSTCSSIGTACIIVLILWSHG